MKPRNLPIHLLLVLGGVAMVLPFFWMLSTSLKAPLEALKFPPTWLPSSPQFQNYAEVFRQIPLWRYLFNTVLVAFLTLTGVLITGIMAAYAFARFRFPGRELQWDGEKMEITNDKDANAYVRRQYREGWHLSNTAGQYPTVSYFS